MYLFHLLLQLLRWLKCCVGPYLSLTKAFPAQISLKICSTSVLYIGECLESYFGGNGVSFPFCLGLALLRVVTWSYSAGVVLRVCLWRQINGNVLHSSQKSCSKQLP